MFEQATRMKLRFVTERGNVTTEDLWDLPLISLNSVDLDSIAINLNGELKESSKKSFVIKRNKKDKIISLKLDIVKHIIKAKLDEEEERDQEANNKIERDKIINILADRENDDRKEMSTEELKDKLKELQ